MLQSHINPASASTILLNTTNVTSRNQVNSLHDEMKVDSHAMQGLLQTMNEGKSKLHLNQVLQSCFKKTTCNGMVSLLRAIAADGFCKHPGRWLTAVQLATECDR